MLKANSWQLPASELDVVPPAKGDLRQWRYAYNVGFPLLSAPDITAPKVAHRLSPEDVFDVAAEVRGVDGILYLKLADGRGWAFEQIPSFPALCKREDAKEADSTVDPDEEAEEEEEVFDLDDFCRKRRAGRLRVPPLQGLAVCHESMGGSRGSGCAPSAAGAGGSGFFARLEEMIACYSCNGCEASDTGGMQLIEQTQIVPNQDRWGKDVLLRGDSFDITFTPRSFGMMGAAGAMVNPMTPRQRKVRDQLDLPKLDYYPRLPNSGGDSEREQRKQLLRVYREFALDLHIGMYLTQLTCAQDYVDVHCQLIEDFTILRQDQSSGHITEFPLTDVSRIYHVKVPKKGEACDHLIVVELVRRKLAFVFRNLEVSQRFMICLELLVQRARQLHGPGPVVSSHPPERRRSSEAVTPGNWDSGCMRPTPFTDFNASKRLAVPTREASHEAPISEASHESEFTKEL